MLLEGEFPPDVRVENEALTLVKAGFEVHIFALTFSQQPSLEEWQPGVWVHRKALRKAFFKKIHITVLKWPIYRRLWEKFVRSQGVAYNALHVHDLPLARVGKVLARMRHVPLILDFHENYPAALGIWEHSQTPVGRLFLDVPSWRAYEFEAVQSADRVIVVVEEALERFRKADIPSGKFTIVSNVLNLETFPVKPESEKSSGEWRLAYVGGFGVHRGLETAIQAMPQILKETPEARLILAGDGRNAAELRALAEELGLTKSVTFTGWLSFDESARVIQTSNICMIPHLSIEHTNTTVPHKLFQYMYLKKPVLVSSSPPLKRIVEATRSGLVFEAGNPEDFAEKAVQMIRSKNLKKWGENGHKAVLKTYNWEGESKKLVQIYRELLNG